MMPTPQNARFLLAPLLLSLLLTGCGQDPPSSVNRRSGEFSLLTYNVAGLPPSIAPGDPEKNIPLISPLLNKYDLALVQEDFFFHDALKAQATHPYRSESNGGPGEFDFGDGLNRFSAFEFAPLQREPWGICSNQNGADCLAPKGFSMAETELAPGVVVDVYNMHLDAGDTEADFAARREQILQLLRAIGSRSAGKAVLVAGDLNLDVISRPRDGALLDLLLSSANLTDACGTLACGAELVDRVLFRSSADLQLQALSWELDREFVDEAGRPLSDHPAISVRFAWIAQ